MPYVKKNCELAYDKYQGIGLVYDLVSGKAYDFNKSAPDLSINLCRLMEKNEYL